MGVHDCPSVYHVPLLLHQQNMIQIIEKRLDLQPKENDTSRQLLVKWTQMTERIERLHETVSIALVGKYTDLMDSYISVVKALEHASLVCNRKLQVQVCISEAFVNSLTNNSGSKPLI